MGFVKRINAEAQKRIDGWVNALTGLGTALDKTTAARFSRSSDRGAEYYETLFHDNRIARRCVEEPAKDMVRRGFEIESPNDIDTAAIMRRWDELDLDQACMRATALARAVGGSAIVLGADDGMDDLSQPLDLRRLRSLRWVRIVGRNALSRLRLYPGSHAKAGETEVFNLSWPSGGASVVIHETRLVIFDGEWVTDTRRYAQDGWGDSLYRSIEDGLAAVGSSFQAINTMLSDSSQGVFKIKHLFDMLTGNEGGDEEIRKRFSIVNAGRSIARVIAVDADSEDFQYIDRTFAGVTDSAYAQMHYLSALTGIPVTKLFGMSPGGLNSTGESDMRNYYDDVAKEQVTYLRPRQTRLLDVVMSAKEGPTRGKVPAEWSIRYRPLRELDELQQAQLRKTVAEADAIEITSQVLLPEEVAISRYGGDRYSTTTQIDLKLRESLASGQAEDEPEQETDEGETETEEDPQDDPAAE